MYLPLGDSHVNLAKLSVKNPNSSPTRNSSLRHVVKLPSVAIANFSAPIINTSGPDKNVPSTTSVALLLSTFFEKTSSVDNNTFSKLVENHTLASNVDPHLLQDDRQDLLAMVKKTSSVQYDDQKTIWDNKISSTLVENHSSGPHNYFKIAQDGIHLTKLDQNLSLSQLDNSTSTSEQNLSLTPHPLDGVIDTKVIQTTLAGKITTASPVDFSSTLGEKLTSELPDDVKLALDAVKLALQNKFITSTTSSTTLNRKYIKILSTIVYLNFYVATFMSEKT